ncbi:MAG: sulfotransferase [Pseudomonadota bacterium]
METHLAAPHSLSDQRDLVIYGALRSGSTLLRLMVNQNPELHCPGEIDFLFDHIGFDETSQSWVMDIASLKMDRIFLSSGLDVPDSTEAGAAVQDMIAQYRARDSRRLVIMVHRNVAHIRRYLNDPLIVHLLRDPRDVAASSISLEWAGNVYYGADHWINTEGEWGRDAADLDPSSLLELRFEELIADPEKTLSELCSFFGTSFSPAMLEYHKTSTYAPVDPSLSSQWKTKRTEQEIALVELRVGGLLASRGFAPSGVEPIELSRLGEWRLWLSNKSHVWKLKFKRHGLYDPMALAVCNRLGLQRFAVSAQMRVNERSQKMLK